MDLTKTLSRYANIALLLIPLVTLIGWATQIDRLKFVFHIKSTAMNPMSAICFLLLGGALFVAREGSASRRNITSLTLAALSLLISLFHAYELPLSQPLRLDHLLFTDQLNGHGMPTHTAIGFVIASFAVLFFRYRGVRALTLSPLLALGVGWLALLAITGYFYGVDILNHSSAYAPMAFGSAITFLFFSVSVLLAKAEYEPTRTVVSLTDAGRIARILIPLALVFPIFSGWMRMTGESMGLFDPKLGVTIFALINIAIWASAIWTTAHYLYRAEQKNKYLIEFLDKNAKTDLLSGLWNRRFLEERLQAENAVLRRHGRVFSLIICDIDFFKKVNDTYGHAVGDLVIKLIADTLSTTARKTDVVCRFGGEEFVVLLPDTKLNEAKQVAERLRAAVENSRIVNNGETLRATCSFGVSEAVANDSTLVERADAHLYTAKQAGRNCVISDGHDTSLKSA